MRDCGVVGPEGAEGAGRWPWGWEGTIGGHRHHCQTPNPRDEAVGALGMLARAGGGGHCGPRAIPVPVPLPSPCHCCPSAISPPCCCGPCATSWHCHPYATVLLVPLVLSPRHHHPCAAAVPMPLWSPCHHHPRAITVPLPPPPPYHCCPRAITTPVMLCSLCRCCPSPCHHHPRAIALPVPPPCSRPVPPLHAH